MSNKKNEDIYQTCKISFGTASIFWVAYMTAPSTLEFTQAIFTICISTTVLALLSAFYINPVTTWAVHMCQYVDVEGEALVWGLTPGTFSVLL